MDEGVVKIVGHIVWPVTLLILAWCFYQPLSDLVKTLGRRITKLSAFKVKVELGSLSRARTLAPTVDKLRNVLVMESGLTPIVAGVVRSGSADYLTIEIGGDGDENWLTSRLFLLAAILERSRAVRCVVFLGEKQRFIGAARARDIRYEIGSRFLAYEASLASAYGALANLDVNVFRGLSEPLIDQLGNVFLRSPHISRPHANPQDVGWIKLERQPPQPTTWEFADWVTEGSLSEMLGGHLMTGSVAACTGPASQETTKAIVSQAGSFVALVTKSGTFQDLCDRDSVLDAVAKKAIEQTEDADETAAPRKRASRSAVSA
jgi:hypothetical protein